MMIFFWNNESISQFLRHEHGKFVTSYVPRKVKISDAKVKSSFYL